MTTAGPNSPGTAVSDATVGSVAWTNPGNSTASDDSDAVAGPLNTSNTPSEYLLVTNFGFSIPAGATIDGITVDVEKASTQANRVTDNAVRIVKGGTIGSTDKSSGVAWPTSDGTTSYGGVSDLWGETWAYTDINASTFGFAISAQAPSSGNRNAEVDHIQITIDYTAGGTEYTQSVAGGLSFAGVPTKKTEKPIAGTSSFAGAIVRKTEKPLAGAASFVGTLTKKTTVFYAGVVSFAGATAQKIVFTISLAGGISFSGDISKKALKPLAGVSSFAGVVAKKTAVSYAGGISFVGGIAKKTKKALQGVIDFIGSLATEYTSGDVTITPRQLTLYSRTNTLTLEARTNVLSIYERTNVLNLEER